MMKAKLRELYQKYGDYVFRLALCVLFYNGMKNIKESELEKECMTIIKSTPENSLVTGEMQANIYRFAYDLSEMTVWDILKFARTDIEIDGAIVHPGMIVEFRQSANGKGIMTLVLPPETTEEQIEELLDTIEREVETNTGSKADFHYENCIKEQIQKAKIRSEVLTADKMFYI